MSKDVGHKFWPMPEARRQWVNPGKCMDALCEMLLMM